MFQALKAENSPFSEQQIARLQNGLAGLDAAQSAWLSGYIAGQLAAQPQTSVPAPAAAAQEDFTVFYASQTGNGEGVAETLAASLQQQGFAVQLKSMGSTRPGALKKLKRAAFVISTHGEGDPPDDALEWFEFLGGDRAPRLEQLEFTVLALGDRSYSEFCAAGRQLEERLLACGAVVFLPRVECDVDYAAAADAWSADILAREAERDVTPEGGIGAAGIITSAPVPRLSLVGDQRWSRSEPFIATVERVQKITGRGSDKDVHHLELSLQDSGMQYQPGDALAVWPGNDHVLVSEVLQRLQLDGDEAVELDGGKHSLHDWLARHRELTRLSPDTVENYARAAGRPDLQQEFTALDPAERREFIEQRQFADLLEAFPPADGQAIGATDVLQLLRPLAPRSYSIASSQAAVEDEVHLTVATLSSNAIGVVRHGVASHQLNHRLQAGDTIPVYLEPNRRFRLPEDAERPVILVAAGTGIAPYRAFLQQLEAEDRRLPVWLIFGNPHLRSDFLYQREWLEWRRQGRIARIDTAFSRDQAQKRYVQHVVAEQGERVEDWLRQGANIYLCGGLAMGKAVERSLQQVLAERRGLDAEQAAAALVDLRREGRLLKDLY